MIKFSVPTAQQLVETEKFRKGLREMKEEDKLTILTDIFKIKKEYEEPVPLERRRLKCPILSCQKIYKEVGQLKTHMRKHPELQRNGIELTEYGVFEYNQRALDFTIALGKMFPESMKKIIKKMKTKNTAS